MYLPRAKGKLLLANKANSGWRKVVPSVSHPPMSFEIHVAVACMMAKQGRLELAIACLLAFDCLLRGGELMNIKVGDIAFAGDRRLGYEFTGGLAIGLPVTKTGPLRWTEVLSPGVQTPVLLLARGKGAQDFLFPSSTARRSRAFYDAFKRACRSLGLSKDYVPHSLRHGGATTLRFRLWPIEDILERGRWASVESARHYVQAGRCLMLQTRVPPHVVDAGAMLARDLVAALALFSN